MHAHMVTTDTAVPTLGTRTPALMKLKACYGLVLIFEPIIIIIIIITQKIYKITTDGTKNNNNNNNKIITSCPSTW